MSEQTLRQPAKVIQFPGAQRVERKPPAHAPCGFLEVTKDTILYRWRRGVAMRDIARTMSEPQRRVHADEIESVIRERLFGGKTAA